MPARWRAGALALLAAYVPLAVLILTWPNGHSIWRVNLDIYLFFFHLGVPRWVTPEVWGFVNNVLLFVPATLALGILVTRLRLEETDAHSAAPLRVSGCRGHPGSVRSP